jgi:methenyltetrahydrofolate cyclohydrolase
VTGPGQPRPPEGGEPGTRGPGLGEPGAAVRLGYLDMRVGEFLDQLADARPDPGGGSAAAVAVALAAALCAMTAELSARQLADSPRLAADARGLLRWAAPLAQADADAYGGVLAARREPGQPGGPSRAERVSAALARATEVPLEVAGLGDRVAALAADIAGRGNPAVRGDALTAARLAAAAAQAAAALVQINLAGAPDDPRPVRATHLAARAARAAALAARQAGGDVQIAD